MFLADNHIFLHIWNTLVSVYAQDIFQDIGPKFLGIPLQDKNPKIKDSHTPVISWSFPYIIPQTTLAMEGFLFLF